LDTAETEGHRLGVGEFLQLRKMSGWHCLSFYNIWSGDVFGVMVTYFGDDMSTVIFLKNGQPVATR
jgi:hypothetical protein